MTVILVTVVPLCLITVAFALVTWHGASNQIRERALRQIEGNMDWLEQSILRIEDYTEEFADVYMLELNADDGFSDPLVPYDMIGDLQRLFSHTGLQGAVYLVCDGTCMATGTDGMYTTQDMEALRSYVASPSAAAFESFLCGGRVYLRREYSYPNGRIGFVVDLPANIADLIQISFTEEVVAYVQSGEKVFRQYADGTIGALTDGDGPYSAMEHIAWQGQTLPLSVSIYYPWYTVLDGIPATSWALLLIAVVFLLLTPLIWLVLKRDVLRPIAKLTAALQEMRLGNEDYRINEHSREYADEMLYLFEAFDAAAKEVRLSNERKVQMVKAELDNLRLQVNPHMLLNSYNMIFALAQSQKYDTIQDYSLHLVSYFRYVLRKTDELVPLRQEIEFIRNYISIQKIRFPNSFRFTYTVGEDCEDALIPPLLIENFVENSLKYALIPGQVVAVVVDMQHMENQLHIAVCDTGNGIKPEVLAALNRGEPYVDPAGNRHIGIWNCMRRVELFYGEKASLEIASRRELGTNILLKIPFRKEKNHEAVDRGR